MDRQPTGGEVFYHWATSRAAACLNNVIPVNFTGTIQCDGYSAYRAFATVRKGAVALAGCSAHVRRKFFESLESSSRTVAWIMRQLQHLYLIESRFREVKAGPRLRQAVRTHQSGPIVARLERVLLRLKSSGRHLPQNLLATAIDYALGQWTSLQVFLNDGRVEIDNNLVENVTQSFGLHSLCREAYNAEKMPGGMRTAKLGIENASAILRIIRSPRGRPRGGKTLARLDAWAVLVR